MIKTTHTNKKRLNDPILGSLPGDFDTTDNPGFNPGGGGNSGLPSDFTDGPLPFDNFPLGPNGGGGDNIDNSIDTGDETNDVNCDYLGTCYDGMQIILQQANVGLILNISSVRSLQRHQDRGECRDQQALQWPDLCTG